MARRGFISIDMLKVEGLADRLEKIDPQRFGTLALDAVNRVAVRSEATARQNIVDGINVTDPYLRARMGVREGASIVKPEAVIYARFRQTPLGRYEPQQQVVVAKRPKRAKGDKSRGIAPGMKQAGVSVEVKRGSRKLVANGKSFTMPLRNGNGIGVFTRDTEGVRFKHRLGPSVYQLFRYQADHLYDDIATDLANEVGDLAEDIAGIL